MESSRCPLSVLCTAANFPATMLPLHASLTASRQFLASMGRRYLGCYTGNMRHNLIPNARPSEMVQQNLFILYSKHIVVHDRNAACTATKSHLNVEIYNRRQSMSSRHKIRRAEIFSSCTKNGVFFSAASCKKETIFGAARIFFALLIL